jgi:dihydrofolate reductase
MRKLAVSEFVTLDGVIQAPGGKDEDRDGGFEHGGWTWPYWHDDIGASFGALMQDVDAFLLGRRTYEIHGQAFEPMPPGDPFGDLMNAPRKYVVSRTLEKPIWRDTTIIRDNVVEAVRALKGQPGRTIMTDGSSQLVHVLLANDLVDELPAGLSVDARQRQATDACRRSLDLPAEIGDALSEWRGRPLLPACGERAVTFERLPAQGPSAGLHEYNLVQSQLDNRRRRTKPGGPSASLQRVRNSSLLRNT